MTARRNRRDAASAKLPAYWRGAALDLADQPATLFQALRRVRRRNGGRRAIVLDESGAELDADTLLTASCMLGAKIARGAGPERNIGLMMPTSAAAIAAFFAIQAIGRTSAVLNFHAGYANLKAACEMSNVKHIVTSRRFIEAAGLQRLAKRLQASAAMMFLEDIRASTTPLDRVVAALRARAPCLSQAQGRADDVAVILFTSGTTGAPKGVALSHANILANIAQCRAHVPFDPDWVFFNALPIFHAFGLTAGALLPILGGMKTVCHASPLDKERIPKRIRSTAANVLVSTDTFASLYARAAAPGALAGLRYVVLGGEALKSGTLELLSQASPAIVLQGYGATECGPVIAVNQPDANRPDTVGRLLPGVEARLEPEAGLAAGARLLVRGPNVMLGYLDPDAPGRIAHRGNDWFDTGDLARVDGRGFIMITGRIKRFAKIGAEMVSLAAVETHADALWPNARHAAVSVDETGHGEAIVLVTEQQDATRADLAASIRSQGAPYAQTPKHVLKLRRMPLLATGKPDYRRLGRIVRRKYQEAVLLSPQAKGVSGAPGKTCST